MNNLLNKIGKEVTTVDETNIAAAVASGSLPVFSTPMMIALMEKAACKCLESTVGDGQTSVGTKVNVEHLAASPIGATITAVAKVEAVSGRKVEFKVESFQTLENEEGFKKIGEGEHTRFIVDEERFMAKL
ncbi:MAG: thioesterase family protein [Oscillospiraceae bacterium]|nr:thioesterase family protein [Oscillospiraceae bacterium]